MVFQELRKEGIGQKEAIKQKPDFPEAVQRTSATCLSLDEPSIVGEIKNRASLLDKRTLKWSPRELELS
jgi:hypothetical protein